MGESNGKTNLFRDAGSNLAPGAAKVVRGGGRATPATAGACALATTCGRKRRDRVTCALRENGPIKYVCSLLLLNLCCGEKPPHPWVLGVFSSPPPPPAPPKTAPSEGGQSSGSWVSMTTRRRSGKGRGDQLSGGKHNLPVAVVSVSHHF